MSWRTVVISSSGKLEYKMGYLVFRSAETQKVHLSEISTLIVESTAVALTATLVCELIKNKINIVFCDEKHNPHSQVLSLDGSHDSSKKIKLQCAWVEEVKLSVWTEIVKNKIKQQADFLQELTLSSQADMLYGYMSELAPFDSTNREGHSAKVYFNALFGMEFSRQKPTALNGLLDYGYAIVLSVFNREIVANGYCTQIGLFHKNEFNSFNFSCDLMEPFRVLVDRKVFSMNRTEVNVESKRQLQNILNEKVVIKGKIYSVNDAIGIYCKSVFDVLNKESGAQIYFYEL